MRRRKIIVTIVMRARDIIDITDTIVSTKKTITDTSEEDVQRMMMIIMIGNVAITAKESIIERRSLLLMAQTRTRTED